MGLLSFALRQAVAKTLRGATLAGQRVYDSPIEPLDEVVKPNGEGRPLIAIYIHETKKTSIDGRRLGQSQGEAELTIQVYSPHRVVLDVNGAPVEIKGTGIAGILDFVERQIEAALVVSDGAWAKIFRRLVTSFSSATSTRLMVRVAEKDDGVFIPLAEISYTLKTAWEPVYGEPMDQMWTEIVNAFKADPQFNAMGHYMQALIELPADMNDWRRAQAVLGATFGDMVNIGLTPPGAIAAEDAPLLAEIYAAAPPVTP